MKTSDEKEVLPPQCYSLPNILHHHHQQQESPQNISANPIVQVPYGFIHGPNRPVPLSSGLEHHPHSNPFSFSVRPPGYVSSSTSSAISTVQTAHVFGGVLNPATIGSPFPSGNDIPVRDNWLANVRKAKADSIEKQLKCQEKNRLAAMKSRQRKKKEWERLILSEKELLEENQRLLQRIQSLEAEITLLKKGVNSEGKK